MTTQTEALKHEINLVLTDPDTNLSHGAKRALDYVLGQLEALAQPEQEPTNLERHERNVQKFLGTQQTKEPEQEPVAKAVVSKRKTDEHHITDIDLTLTEAGKRLGSGEHCLYTTPPQRKPLTDEQIYQMWTDEGLANSYDIYSLKEHVRRAARAIEAAHGIKE